MTDSKCNVFVVDGDVVATINAMDREFGDEGWPVWTRVLMTWFHITGFSQTPTSEPFNRYADPYSGNNLLCIIEDWYRAHYPADALMPEGSGCRLFVVRGQVIAARMPFIFPNQDDRDPFDHAQDEFGSLGQVLDAAEKDALRNRFNQAYVQASDILLVTACFDKTSCSAVLRSLVEASWSDLRAIAGSYRPRDPGEMLFLAHQAAEKSLKAFLVSRNSAVTDSDLRRSFGHDIPKLLDSCVLATLTLPPALVI